MASIAARDEKPDEAPTQVTVVRARHVPSQRNALTAIVLACIAASMFLIVLVAAMLFRYAGAGHALPGL